MVNKFSIKWQFCYLNATLLLTAILLKILFSCIDRWFLGKVSLILGSNEVCNSIRVLGQSYKNLITSWGHEFQEMSQQRLNNKVKRLFVLFDPNPLFVIVNGPGVAGAVLHTASWFIHSFSESVSLFLQIFKISREHWSIRKNTDLSTFFYLWKAHMGGLALMVISPENWIFGLSLCPHCGLFNHIWSILMIS